MMTPTSDWWTHLEAEYPVLVPFYEDKYDFLHSISPLHTRLDDIIALTERYMAAAMRLRPHQVAAFHGSSEIGRALRDAGLEADSYGLLVALETSYSYFLDWLSHQRQSDLFLLEAFLSDETTDWHPEKKIEVGPAPEDGGDPRQQQHEHAIATIQSTPIQFTPIHYAELPTGH